MPEIIKDITLYEGIGKTSKKPYHALKLTVGEWTKLYFVDSQFELAYLIKYLSQKQNPTPEQVINPNSDFLND